MPKISDVKYYSTNELVDALTYAILVNFNFKSIITVLRVKELLNEVRRRLNEPWRRPKKAKKNLEDFEKKIAPFSKKPLKRKQSFEKWDSQSLSLGK